MANTNPYGSKLHIPPSSYHLLATQQKVYKKGSFEKAVGEFCGKKSQENGPLVEKLQDRKNKWTRQKNEEEIGKRNQMTALRFHTWEELSNTTVLP